MADSGCTFFRYLKLQEIKFLESALILTEFLVSKRPGLIAIGNTIEEHIGNIWEHKKIK
jgi:hypothetical protein